MKSLLLVTLMLHPRLDAETLGASQNAKEPVAQPMTCNGRELTFDESTKLKAKCQQNVQLFKCLELKERNPEKASDYNTCATNEEICEYLDGGSPPLYSCLSASGKTVGGVMVDSALGLIYLPQSVWKLATGQADLHTAYNECYQDLDFKKIVLGDFRPTDMTDDTLRNMSCADVQKFTKLKVDIILNKLEDRRRSESTLRGKEIQTADLNLTDVEKSAIAYDHNFRKPAGFQCLRSEAAARSACEKLTHVGLVAAALVTAPTAVRAVVGATARTWKGLAFSVGRSALNRQRIYAKLGGVKAVGWIEAGTNDQSTLWITNYSVDSNYQNLGLGDRLVAKAIELNPGVRSIRGFLAKTNLEEYMNAKRPNMSPEEAIKQTHIYKAAARMGFTEVETDGTRFTFSKP